MTTTLQQRSGASSWQAFCEWVTSTNNRLYVGWFGVLMIPTCWLPPSASSSPSSPLPGRHRRYP